GGRLAGRARRGRAGGRSGPAAGGQQQRAGGGGQEGAAGDGGGRHRHVLHRSLFACHYRSIGQTLRQLGQALDIGLQLGPVLQLGEGFSGHVQAQRLLQRGRL